MLNFSLRFLLFGFETFCILYAWVRDSITWFSKTYSKIWLCAFLELIINCCFRYFWLESNRIVLDLRLIISTHILKIVRFVSKFWNLFCFSTRLFLMYALFTSFIFWWASTNLILTCHLLVLVNEFVIKYLRSFFVGYGLGSISLAIILIRITLQCLVGLLQMSFDVFHRLVSLSYQISTLISTLLCLNLLFYLILLDRQRENFVNLCKSFLLFLETMSEYTRLIAFIIYFNFGFALRQKFFRFFWVLVWSLYWYAPLRMLLYRISFSLSFTCIDQVRVFWLAMPCSTRSSWFV